MPMQLMLDFTPQPSFQPKPVVRNTRWVDVSDIAGGVGFKLPVEVSVALKDALAPLQTEDDAEYDQRLYDALWLAHHYLSLDQRPSITFTFDFLREDHPGGKMAETTLRLRAEAQNQLVLLGLPQDF